MQEHLDAYLAAAEIEAGEITNRKKEPLFRTTGGRGRGLTENRMNRRDAYRMVQRRCKAAGLSDRIGCHSWRGFGITNFLQNGGTLEKAQYLAFHASARTTKLYDRTDDLATQDDIELLSSLG